MASTPSELPPYRALLAVDIRDFSGVLGQHHAEITDAIPTMLLAAFQRCGLAETWRERRFGFSTGDGYVAGFPSAVLPFLLNPFLQALQDELDFRDQVDADPVPLRMRVSVHVGPVTDTGRELLSEGSGTARIETHRYLDAEPVRELLNRSGSATRVAAIVPAQAYRDAVLSGYAADPPEHYVAAHFPSQAAHRLGVSSGPFPRVATCSATVSWCGPSMWTLPTARKTRPGRQRSPTGPPPKPRTPTRSTGQGNVNSGSGTQTNNPGTSYDDRRRP